MITVRDRENAVRQPFRDFHESGEGYSFSVFATQSRAPLISSSSMNKRSLPLHVTHFVYDFLNY
jgi:hypothetical protein